MSEQKIRQGFELVFHYKRKAVQVVYEVAPAVLFGKIAEVIVCRGALAVAEVVVSADNIAAVYEKLGKMLVSLYIFAHTVRYLYNALVRLNLRGVDAVCALIHAVRRIEMSAVLHICHKVYLLSR